MRSIQKNENKTTINQNSGSVASNTRSKTNKSSICLVNTRNKSKKTIENLQKKKKYVRKFVKDTTHSDINRTQNVQTNLVILLDDCALKKEIPKKSEDDSETAAPVAAISTQTFYKTENVPVKEVDVVSNKKSNVRKKASGDLVRSDSYRNLKIKRLRKTKNKRRILSKRKLLKSREGPPGEVNSSQKNPESSGITEEVKDLVVEKLPNIVIQRNFSENTNGCDNERKICKVWLSGRIDKLNNSNNSTSEKFPNNDVITNEIKPSPPPNNDFSDSELKEEKITKILNGFIDCTNSSDVESSATTFSNLSPNSNCALCVDVPKQKKLIHRTDDDLVSNPFANYRLESCNFNIKITKNFQTKTMPSRSFRVCKKRWTNNYFFKLHNYIIRITSKDSIFCDAILEKDDLIKEYLVTSNCVLNTENLRDVVIENDYVIKESKVSPKCVLNIENLRDSVIEEDNVIKESKVTPKCALNIENLRDAVREKDSVIKENKVTTKCVFNKDSLRDGTSQKSSSPSPHNFLLPLLPPAKRPPTRRLDTAIRDTEDYNLIETSPPEDDAISLFACSIVASPEMDPECLDDNINDTVTDRSDNIRDNSSAYSAPHKNYNVKEVINLKTNNSPKIHEIEVKPKSVNSPKKYEKGVIKLKSSNCPKNHEKEVINSNPDNSPNKYEKEEPQINRPRQTVSTYNYVPEIFKGVCYHHFNKKNCRRKPYCTRLHGLYPNTEEAILNLPYEQLEEVYNFTKGKVFYKETFPFFIKALVQKKKILGLVSIVRDVVNQDMFERSPFVEKIVEAIQCIGYSFYQAIDEIITIIGITNFNICLSDILINIVVRSSPNLEADWQLIKKLTKYRTYKLDHGVVEDIIRICVKFKNVQLCVNTFQDILNTDLAKLEYLDLELLKGFVIVLRQLNCVQESNVLAEKANIPLNDVVVDNNTKDVASEMCLKENAPYQLEENTSLRSFSEDEQIYETSYDFDEVSASMSYSEAEIATQNCCDTVLPINSTASEISCASKNISTKKISSLTTVIKDKDVSKFLGILEQYKSEEYVQSFVCNVIGLLEKEDIRDVYKMMFKIFNTISTDKYKGRFWFEPRARYVLETLSFNVIAFFDRTKSWRHAANIIKKFSNDYVNFVKAKCTKIHKYEYTELGKYLYFCKIFTRAGYLQDAYELFMDPDLRLLNENTTWTIPHSQSFDTGYRDDIVKRFLIKSISTDVDLAKKIILRLIRDSDCIINIDVWQYFNDLLVALMNNQQYQDILDMLDDLLNGWNLKLKKEVFRGLLIILLRLPDVDPLKITTLFVCACKRGFYKLYTGAENEIVLKTDMLCEEIYLILHMFFFKKFSCDSLVFEDLSLKLQLPEVVDDRPSLLLNSNVSLNDFRIKVYRVLAVAFYHPICVEETCELFSIIIDKRQLEILLHFYKNQNNFFL